MLIIFLPRHTDLAYYVLSHLSQGGENLTLSEEIKEIIVGLPAEG